MMLQEHAHPDVGAVPAFSYDKFVESSLRITVSLNLSPRPDQKMRACRKAQTHKRTLERDKLKQQDF